MFESKAKDKSFNVGSGESTSVIKVAETLKELYNSSIDISITSSFRLGDIRHNCADISMAKQDLDFVPRVMFDKGISMFSDWVKTQKIQKDDYDESIKQLQQKGLIK